MTKGVAIHSLYLGPDHIKTPQGSCSRLDTLYQFHNMSICLLSWWLTFTQDLVFALWLYCLNWMSSELLPSSLTPALPLGDVLSFLFALSWHSKVRPTTLLSVTHHQRVHHNTRHSARFYIHMRTMKRLAKHPGITNSWWISRTFFFFHTYVCTLPHTLDFSLLPPLWS